MENLAIGQNAQKAQELYRRKACPHCGETISTFDAIALLWGDGYRQYVVAISEDGTRAVIPISVFNPQTMQLADD
jgi:transcriptional regulator NrdR family protein